MKPVIKIENLSKQYRLGTVGTGTFAHDVNRWWHSIWGKEDPYLGIGESNDRSTKGDSDYVWALKGVNFEVMPGEVLGIIGKNGAGKSTLLKMLSRVTAPTTGSIEARGRIASLLEVGTGFHPELTGRENVFLNGAIMGMTKRDIRSKFEEIVDFSGCERYIDTPVKRYSSGMYVRLAFAVAAHLEPEILIVDEVLAVGDAEFQKKAIGKMKDVSQGEGRTVLFVSHNMAAVKNLCKAGIVLENGLISFMGNEIEAVKFYQNNNNLVESINYEGELERALGNDKIKILKFKVLPLDGDIISISSGLKFEILFYNAIPQINLDVTFELITSDDIPVFHSGALITTKKNSEVGIYKVRGSLPKYYLNAGSYKFKLIFGENQRYLLFKLDDVVQFEVLNESLGSNSAILPGVLRPNIEYQINLEELS